MSTESDNLDQVAWAAQFKKPPTLSAKELALALVAAGIGPDKILLYDETYRMVTPGWIEGPLAKAFNQFLFSTGIKFTVDTFDCNAYSASAAVIARWCWAAEQSARPIADREESALAFGTIAIPMHMLCVAVHWDTANKRPRVAFYEPQPDVPQGERVFSPQPLTQTTLSEGQLRLVQNVTFL